MPTEKRERQRANKSVKQAELQKIARQRKLRKRAIVIAIAVVVIAALFIIPRALSSSSPKKSATPAAQAAGNVTAPGTVQPFASPSAGETTSADCPSNFKATLTKPNFTSPPPMTISASKQYYATVKTDIGSFVIELNSQQAPNTVNNFVFLAEHHFYDCVVFHRVIQGFMDQTGDPTGTGQGGPGYKFADELPATASPQYPTGSVAMANSGPNTNGSQFFIVTGAQGQSLPPSYSLFGKVISGMTVVQKVNADGAAADPNPPKVLHRMISVTISAT